MGFPTNSKYIIIGAGIHGLSTAYHLALSLKARGLGGGSDVIVLDKGGIAAGASGIACGIVRNNYFQPAMRELMAHSVDVWEEDAEAYSYHSVGYMQISCESMREDIGAIYQQQCAIGYESDFIDGADDSDKYIKGIFEDWQAKGITSVLHEKRGGYANNKASIQALAQKAKSEGVRIFTDVEVKSFVGMNGAGSAIKSVETDKGSIDCEYIVVGTGPWVRDFWHMLEMPGKISVRASDGTLHHDVSMWKYWQLEEGVLEVDPNFLVTNDRKMPPVMHVDTDAPLYSDVDGSLLSQEMWGVYYKPDFNFNGVQGGAMPHPVETETADVAIDPYGPSSPEFVASKDFSLMWCSALAHCHKRFEGKYAHYLSEPSGGVGCFTPDSFPVFDVFRSNCFVIADSNHGYKMIGVGKLVAEEILGANTALLSPFRFSRFESGDLHPVSNSPYPWS